VGFSVSGSAAIIFVGMFIAFGMWHTAAANSFEQVADAEAAQSDAAVERQNTAVSIASATYDADAEELTVAVENAGASQLRLSTTDILVDGTYETGWADTATVAGEGDTDLWLSGERLTATVAATSQPDRVKVVTESGVADTAGVTAA